MKKIKFFSMLLIALFSFTLAGVINANAEGETVEAITFSDFYKSSTFTGVIDNEPDEGMVSVTMAKAQTDSQLRTDVANRPTTLGLLVVDFTISHDMKVSCAIGNSYDGHPSYTAGRHKAMVDVSTWTDQTSFRLGFYLDYGVAADSYGDDARTFIIHSIEFADISKYDSSKPTTIGDFKGNPSYYVISKNENNEPVINCPVKPGYDLLSVPVLNHNTENKMLVMTYTSKNPINFGFKTNANSDYISHKSYPSGKNTIRVDISKLVTNVFFELQMYIDCDYVGDWSANSFTIHSVTFINPNIFNEEVATEYSEIYTSKTGILSKNSDNEPVISYDTASKPGWSGFNIDIFNHDPAKTQLNIVYSANKSFELAVNYIAGKDEGGKDINVNEGHNPYEAGKNKVIKLDLSDTSRYTYGPSFTLTMFFDSNVTSPESKSITIHSFEYVIPEVEAPKEYDPNLPTTCSDITVSASDGSTVTKNETNQVISYPATQEGKTRSWIEYKINIGNYNPNKTQLNIVYSSLQDFVLCVNYHTEDGDKNNGHLSYFAAKERTIKLDFSDKEKFQFGVDFTLILFFDAAKSVEAAKEITIHSIEFVTPDPAPTTFTINEPVGKDGVVVRPSATEVGKWVASYTVDSSWRYVEYTVLLHDASYDIISFSLNTVANTNLGVDIYYTLNGQSDSIRVRDHAKDAGLILTAGDNTFTYWLKAYGLEDAKITSVRLYLDNPTPKTVNEGEQSIVINEFAFLKSTELADLEDLAFTLEDTTVDYTGEAALVNVECDEENIEFKYQYSLVVEGNEEVVWDNGLPTNVGVYNVRVIYMGSLEFAYEVVEAKLTINKVAASVSQSDLVINQETGEVTLGEGIIAATSQDFAQDTLLETGDFIDFDTTVYFYREADGNHTVSETLSRLFEMTLEQVKTGSIAVVVAQIGQYSIDKAPYETAINACTTKEAVETALASALLDIAVKKARIDAIAALEGYKSADLYRDAEKATLTEKVNAGKTAINAATTKAKVDEALAAAKAEIDKIKTAAQYDEEEFEDYQETAIAALEGYKSADLYRDAEKATLTEKVNAGKTAINAATTKVKVDEALAAAKAEIDKIKTDAQYDEEEAAEAAKQALATAKNNAKTALEGYKSADLYRDAEKATLTEKVNAGKTAIDAATTEELVAEALAAAKVEIDKIKTDAQYDEEEAAAALAKAKSDAIAAVAAEIGSYNIDKASYESAINAATSVDAVNAALASAKTDIAAKKAAIDEANKPAPTPTPEPEPQKPAKKGCKGALVPSILGVVALLGACFAFRRKDEE